MSVPTLEVLEPGLLTTVQDTGRYGYQRYGVPVSGAMDLFALRAANALAGNDAVTQAIEFQRMLSFDGAALCKLDTDAKGGAALSIAHATGRPIVLAGVGQGYDDLLKFDPEWFVNSVLD